MKKILLVLLTIISLMSSSVYGKPSIPISVSIEAQGNVIKGQPVDFLVTVSSRISTDKLQVNILLSENIMLKSGKLNWKGPVRSEYPVKIEFSAVLLKEEASIIAEAILEWSNDNRLVASTIYHYGKSGILNKFKPQSKQFYRDGRKIIEFPINVSKQ